MHRIEAAMEEFTTRLLCARFNRMTREWHQRQQAYGLKTWHHRLGGFRQLKIKSVSRFLCRTKHKQDWKSQWDLKSHNTYGYKNTQLLEIGCGWLPRSLLIVAICLKFIVCLVYHTIPSSFTKPFHTTMLETKFCTWGAWLKCKIEALWNTTKTVIKRLKTKP